MLSDVFTDIAEAPHDEQIDLYRLARDIVYFGFAAGVLAPTPYKSLEEHVVSLEFVGSALNAFLPKPEIKTNFYYDGNNPSEVTQTLNTAELAVRLAQVGSEDYKLADSRRRSNYRNKARHGEHNHLDDSFPTDLPKANDPRWHCEKVRLKSPSPKS